MFDDAQDESANRALRAGLVDLPMPEVSATFDSRIQLALQPQPAWWQVLWESLRPALPATVVTMCGMFLLLHLIQQPIGTQTASSLASADSTGLERRDVPKPRGKGGEDALENSDAAYASLSFFSHPLHRGTADSG